jgi:RHS repeat-associated protein
VLVETSGGAETIYLYGHARLAQVEGADAEWFLGDALSSVRQVVDDGGEVVLARDYSPFGVVLSESGTGGSGYGFTGEQWDSYMRYLYLRARWYSPSVGRFVSVDPWEGSIQQPGTPHKYVYVQNNAPNYTDPTGMWRWWLTPSTYHFLIENYYETFPLNSMRQLEYPIPLTPWRHADMFNSATGDVYEIEPWFAKHQGAAQVVGYVADLSNAAAAEKLAGKWLGIRYNWNGTPFRVGTGIDWPGKYRVPFAPNFPMFDLVADYVGQGVVIYWLEPNASLVVVPLGVAKRLIRPNGWNPRRLEPGLRPAYVTSWGEACGYTLIAVGGIIIAVTVIEDIATLGVGTFDDVITVPAGLLFIKLGQKLAVLVPASP